MAYGKSRYEWLVEALTQHNSDECLLWPFQRDEDGYGRLSLPKIMDSDNRNVGAHRLAFQLVHGRWPSPCCLHSCDNPPCFNPRHLSEGTNQQNQADKVSKGRQLIGVMQHSAVLSEEEVIAARKEYKEGNIGFGKLVQKYNISRLAMRWAVEGKTWSHIPGAVRALRIGALRKDFCHRGHPLSDDTCYIYGQNRQCKECTALRAKGRYS